MRELRLDNPDLPIAEIMRRWPETVQVFIARSMQCVGCVIGPFHTLEGVCAEYGIDPEVLIVDLRAAITRAAGPA